MKNTESELTELRELYKGRKDIITPSIFSGLSQDRKQEVFEEMLAAAREEGIRRAKIYKKLSEKRNKSD